MNADERGAELVADPGEKFAFHLVESFEHSEVGERCRLRLPDQATAPPIRQQDDREHGRVKEGQSRGQNDVQLPRLAVDGRLHRGVGQVELERTAGRRVAIEHQRYVDLDQRALQIVAGVLRRVTIRDPSMWVAGERAGEVVLDLERSPDDRVVVRVHDCAAAVPNLDPPYVLVHRRALQLVIDVRDLHCGQPLAQLPGIEQRPNRHLSDQGAAALGGIQVALLEVDVQLVAEDGAQRNDWHQGQQTEARQRSQRVRSEVFRGGHCGTPRGAFSHC